MQNRNYIPVSVVLALFYWVIDSLLHWRMSGEQDFELFPADLTELWIRLVTFFLLVCFGLYANLHTKMLIAKEEEKRKIFIAVTGTTRQILSDFLNEIFSFKREAERIKGFNKKNLYLLEKAVRNATEQVEMLGNVSDISAKQIKKSVKPDVREP